MKISDVQTLFKRHFGSTPTCVVRAPAPLELLGSLAEHNEGLALALAVDNYAHMAVAPRRDGKIELVSANAGERELFWLSDLKKNPAAPWADYVKAVLDQLRRRGVNFSGFNAAIFADGAVGAGTASPAALEVAVVLAVRRLYPFSLTELGATIPPKPNVKGELPPLAPIEKLHLARLCEAAADRFLGAPCGWLAPLISLRGKAWQVLCIDCRFRTVEYAPLVGEAIVVCGAAEPLPATMDQVEIRRTCESAARKLGARSLRSVELRFLEASKSKLTSREYECAKFVAGENARVAAAERVLREEDHRQFGQYLFGSHAGARDLLDSGASEQDWLVEIARAHPGCLGARLACGGGGAMISLVNHHQAERFMDHMTRKYQERTGAKLKPRLCQIVDGAGG